MALTQQPVHFNNHLMASSPFQENGPSPSSPLSQSSEPTRYFSGAGEYDESSLHGYSSPPSSVPSSGNASFVHPFADFQEYCSDASFSYNSSPLNLQHVYEAPNIPMPPSQLQMLESSSLTYTGGQDVESSPLQYPAPEGFYAVHDHEQHQQQPQQAERARMIPGLNMDRPDPDPSVYRPEPKRRKTCPDELMSSPIKRCRVAMEKRGSGKDGEDVWPTDVEIAFFEAIRLIPKLGRKKVCINGKPCGRNELVGDYIRRKTGRIRSRKQVSSHIQVLKNIRKHDYEFMDLVAEPKPGEAVDDFTTDEKRTLFFLPQEFAHITPENAPPELPLPYSGFPGLLDPSHPQAWPSLSPAVNNSLSRDGLLSPYCGGSFNFAAQSSSSGASSPALSAVSGSGRSVSPYPVTSVQTPSNEEFPLSNQVFQMKLAPPSPAIFMAMPPAGLDTPVVPTGAIKGEDTAATPKGRPSKLGHRRVASRGLALTIPPNTFGANQQNQQADNQDPFSIPTIEAPAGQEHHQAGMASNPTTPWPQMLHTPTCPPPAPNMLPSPSQRHRLTQIWAQSSADWNKASPALEQSFEHELAAAVASSKNMQDAASRSSVPLKRSYTDIPVFSAKEPKLEHVEKQEDPDNFFSSLLGSRNF